MSFGDNLKKLREKAGLSQAALGAKMGLKGSAIGRYELGEATPKPDRILEFAYALETTPNELLNFKEKRISDIDYVYKQFKDFNNITEENGKIKYRLLTDKEAERMNIKQPKSTPDNTVILPKTEFLNYVKSAREHAKATVAMYSEKYESDTFIAVLDLIMKARNNKKA